MARPDLLSRISRLILIGAAVLLLVPQGAPAHSPTDMQLAFDQGNRILSVTITHTVADPSTHYIKRVLITTGSSVLGDTAYTSQPSPQTFTYTYLIPQGVNGDVQVKAECSIFGSITRSLQIQEASPGMSTPTRGDVPVPSTAMPTKAVPGLLPLAAAIVLAAWRFKR